MAEAILILASVALGFAASEFAQYLQERGIADRVLRGVLAKIEQNETALAALETKHRHWRNRMAAAVPSGNRSALEILVDARPDDESTIGLPLKRAAWQMAISSGALRLLEYEVASPYRRSTATKT